MELVSNKDFDGAIKTMRRTAGEFRLSHVNVMIVQVTASFASGYVAIFYSPVQATKSSLDTAYFYALGLASSRQKA